MKKSLQLVPQVYKGSQETTYEQLYTNTLNNLEKVDEF